LLERSHDAERPLATIFPEPLHRKYHRLEEALDLDRVADARVSLNLTKRYLSDITEEILSVSCFIRYA
jgi:hypothetical protein